MRTDHLSPTDHEGTTTFISAHGTLESANAAAQSHADKLVSSHDFDGPNTQHSKYDDGTAGIVVIVGEEDYHSFEIRVAKEELVGGTVGEQKGRGETKEGVKEGMSGEVKEKAVEAVTEESGGKEMEGKGEKKEEGKRPTRSSGKREAPVEKEEKKAPAKRGKKA